MERARKWKKRLQFHFGLTLAGQKWNPPPFFHFRGRFGADYMEKR